MQADPFGFINALKGPVCLDEVQRAPGVFLAIKAADAQTLQDYLKSLKQ
ncbi:hypothetical protein [Azotobacter chroococcum]|nr:hypothetical protein [Azotobacter chroococcum]